MSKKGINISSGLVHKVPEDLRKALASAPAEVLDVWNDITPIARRDWICWVISVKKEETREEHIRRLCESLMNGKRRVCCFAGCKHR